MLARPSSLLLALALAVPTVAPGEALAEWRRSSEVTHNTAFTLEQGQVEIGVLTPLTVGLTDEVQAALHPVLLLLGQPYIAVRWRLTHFGPVNFALNVGAAWSFIRREDADGRPATSESVGTVGFPGSMQLTGTFTFRAGSDWLLSVGAGPAIDLLGAEVSRGLVEVHAGVHWLIDRSQLLMLQASSYLAFDDSPVLRRPLVQLMYAVALSSVVHLGGGVGFGEFIFEPSESERETLAVFPVLDLWFRF